MLSTGEKIDRLRSEKYQHYCVGITSGPSPPNPNRKSESGTIRRERPFVGADHAQWQVDRLHHSSSHICELNRAMWQAGPSRVPRHHVASGSDHVSARQHPNYVVGHWVPYLVCLWTVSYTHLRAHETVLDLV